MLKTILQQGIDRQISYWIGLIIIISIVAAIAIVFWWGNSAVFSTTASIIDKHWERSTLLTHRVCNGFEGCSWQPRQRAHLSGDSSILPSWPEMREPKRLERIRRKETYYIELFDRDRDKVYTRKTHDYAEYQASKISSVYSVTIDNFGNVQHISEIINN